MTFEDREDFLRRWSRRKREAADKASSPPAASDAPAKSDPAPAAEARAAAPAVPPPLESLSPESDFRAFMDGTIDPRTRNAALKKLFADPRFNVIDPLDIDIDDYSQLERLPEAVVKALAHARSTLLGREEEARAEKDRGGQAPEAGAQETDDAARATQMPESLRVAAHEETPVPGAEESRAGGAQDRDDDKR